ncbi:tripartite tricarboxylate transporter substrate binding protein [uncultured Thalassospira sp.]|jgi:tripartite-type tricarboxylate transporter receptor subunit TctC|uniref:Bug family tripartite tricarboxylate transporter substrate binding protein n=1 Tax=uncultured Thalassospira sp. TaxID=404382 RepID=UPI0030DD64E4|tara:strand:+ start:7802 stop:8752 length:951 start_codon:yes stop_codon:yes gene_type:complete
MKLKTLILSACLVAGFTSAAMAEYPEKKIEIIVGYSAGGGTDVMARTVAPFLERYLGNGATVVVKNMPGASGQIGVTEVANAKPDGYTIGTYNLPGMMARTLDRKAGYSADSFTYLANVVDDPNVIVTAKDSPITTVDKLVEAARKEPGAITVGMSSLGGDDHFFLIRLQNESQAEYTIVPFKGSAPARTAVMGGHVSMGIFNLSEVLGFRDDLNIVGVARPERSDLAPNVPTFTEQGFKVVSGSMRGFVAPANLPKDVETKLVNAFKKAYQDPEFSKAMLASGNPVSLAAGDDFKALNQEQFEFARHVWETTPWK